MFYSAMSAEILRICKASTKFQDFIRYAKILTGRIIKEGSDKPHEQGSIETIQPSRRMFH